MASINHHHESDHAARERDAFNAAFRELGLRWHWDAATFLTLAPCADDAARVRTYLESREAHLLRAYDASFLVGAICAAKERLVREDAAQGRARRVADCAEYATAQMGF
jgi:hypothetical protein